MALAPIALFVYNRPEHTKKTLEALAENKYATESTLYIFADGPKLGATPEELLNIQETRNLIRQRKWCKEVFIKENDLNVGLAKSIINGVTKVVNQFGKIIVLEDDIVTSPGFLTYMNNALNLYADEEKVMHVSGYWFPVNNWQSLPETFFYNTASCWGWGTWASSWSKFESDPVSLMLAILNIPDGKTKFNIEDKADFFYQLESNANLKIETWAVKWYATIFLNNGFSLHPRQSLTNNIGHDDTGTYCYSSSSFLWQTLAESINVSAIPLEENIRSRALIGEFYTDLKPLIINKSQNLIKKYYNFGKKTIRRLLNKKAESSFLYSFLESLPRYTKVEINLLGNKIEVIDTASFIFMYKEIFEKKIYQFYSTSESPLIVDAGANIGLSIIYFKKLYPTSRIIGIEPDEKIFEVLSTNLTSYNFDNIELHNVALWSKNEKLKFYAEGADGGNLFSTDTSFITVNGVTLRSIIGNQHVDFLKVDIEGAETIVLEESKDLLKNIKNIFVEYHSFLGKPQTLNKVLNILTESGFRLLVSSPGVTNFSPYVNFNTYNGMDFQLNIFGYRY